MKIGIRKPNIKKSIKARTTGKMKRKMKGAINPLYGKKGMGMINNPKKAIYNKVYNKTSIGVGDIIDSMNSDCKSTINTNRRSGNGVLIFVAILFFPITIAYFLLKWLCILVMKIYNQIK